MNNSSNRQHFNLLEAKKNKKDEFYTLYEEIEEAVGFYKESFKDKKVLCNCNNSENSNFYKYFIDHFKELQIKELVCTTYARRGRGRKLRAYLDKGELKIEKSELQGNGDFASEECIDLLDACDLVCDNPPFSRFIDFINLLESHNKKYLVLGNLNTIISKDVFPLIMDGKSWVIPNKLENIK